MTQTARANARALPIGKARRLALAEETKVWLSELFLNVVDDSKKFALVAVGGFGRGELTLGSDLDLLLLHEDTSKVQKVAEAIWYPIWDQNIKLDHSVRTVLQTREMANAELAVFLGLLDARCLAGNSELVDELKQKVLSDWRAGAKNRLPELQSQVEKRKNIFGELPHLVEPNLKESYGGLREAVIIRAIAATWVTDIDHSLLENALAVLMDARDGLHQATNSDQDVLLRQEQSEVAQLLNYENSESLLRAVAKAAKSISHLSDLAWYRALSNIKKTNLLSRFKKTERAPLADGVVVQGEEVVLARDVNLKKDANLLLRASAAAAQAGLILAPHTLARFKNEIEDFKLPLDAAAKNDLISLLGSGRFLLTIFDLLDENELIDKFLPSWQRVRSLPHSSPVHTWTVDRHLLETVINAVPLARSVSRPDLLFVACLLHDIGKGESADHTEVGVKIAKEVLPTLGFDDFESEIITRLIEHHLLLSDVATKRDITDLATINFVKEKVVDQEFLNLLYALTLADAKATGPLVDSDWRRHLLAQLYEKVKAELASDTSEIIQKEIDDLAELYDYEVDFLLEVKHDKPASEVLVVTKDQPRLLAKVASVLSFHHLEIRSARTKTINGQAILLWKVSPEFGEFVDIKIIETDIRNSLFSDLNLSEKLAQRAHSQKIPFDIPPSVVKEVVDVKSDLTVIEVRGHNQPGLLAKLTSAVSDLNIVIQAALVQTLGSEVVDVFYLTQANGAKLTTEQVTALIADLDYACTYVRPVI